jgi:predicted small lipoprotein YifL
MQRFLQVDDDLAAVGKHQGNHAPGALVVNVGLGAVIDVITCGLDRFERTFGQVLEFCVGHYNFTMLNTLQILVRTIVLAVGAASLAGCGQTGDLYLPTDAAAANRASLPQTLLPAKTPASAVAR